MCVCVGVIGNVQLRVSVCVYVSMYMCVCLCLSVLLKGLCLAVANWLNPVLSRKLTFSHLE